MTVNLTVERMAALAAGAKPTSIETGTLAGLVRFGSPEHRKAAQMILRREQEATDATR